MVKLNTSIFNEAEDAMKHLQSHKGVVGTITVNSHGIPIKSSYDSITTIHCTSLLGSLTDLAKIIISDLDPENELVFLRVRSKNQEIIVAPSKDYTLIVMQEPVD